MTRRSEAELLSEGLRLQTRLTTEAWARFWHSLDNRTPIDIVRRNMNAWLQACDELDKMRAAVRRPKV